MGRIHALRIEKGYPIFFRRTKSKSSSFAYIHTEASALLEWFGLRCVRNFSGNKRSILDSNNYTYRKSDIDALLKRWAFDMHEAGFMPEDLCDFMQERSWVNSCWGSLGRG